jgi:hypothetical protein
MTTKLPDELREAIKLHPKPVRLEDDQTNAVYFVIDEETHLRAMRALQEKEDWESVQRGLKDREQGNELPLAEADTKIREELGFPPRA